MIDLKLRSRALTTILVSVGAVTFGLGAIGATVPPQVLTRDFVSLETLNYDEVCGEDSGGKTRCMRGGTDSTWIPDGVGVLTEAFSNTKLSCGFDEDGLKCWQLPSGTQRFNGQSEADAIRRLLQESKIDSIRTSPNNICGTDAKSQRLTCLVTDWVESVENTILVSSKKEIHALDISDFVLCWAERESDPAQRRRNSNSKISCLTQFPNILKLPPIPPIKSLTEITVGYDWVCARSKTEARCWSERTAVSLDTDLLEAKSWHSAHDSLCALARDNRVLCINPKSGKPNSSSHNIPHEYTEPNLDVESLWIGSDQSCVATLGKKVLCWNRWSTSTSEIDFGQKLKKFFGSSSEPCGILSDGRAECRLSYIKSRTLSKSDRIRVEFGGYNKCFWNSSGIDCRGRFDNISYRSVKSLSASRDQDSLCVIGVRTEQASDFETVQCYSYLLSEPFPPFELSNPTSVAVSDDKACAISDDGLTCWGIPYDDVPMPTLMETPKKVLMGRRHACALDNFGLVCWGELAAFNLEVPSDFQQPGRVVDFALGASRTCVVLDTGRVECWGRDYELSGPPPQMSSVKSLLGRGGLFCALDGSRVRCWGGESGLPK